MTTLEEIRDVLAAIAKSARVPEDQAPRGQWSAHDSNSDVPIDITVGPHALNLAMAVEQAGGTIVVNTEHNDVFGKKLTYALRREEDGSLSMRIDLVEGDNTNEGAIN